MVSDSVRRPFVFTLTCLFFAASASAGELDPAQQKWIDKYKTQTNVPNPAEQLINTDPEPDLSAGFTSLFDGKGLNGWTPRGGSCPFTIEDDCIVGTCEPGSPSTYLCTDRSDFTNFIFTCDMLWEVDGNTGIMFRAATRKGRNDEEIVFGPQAEMEGFSQDRGWSGGIYGQSCGGYFYPLWLKEHAEARTALKKGEWNRVTILADGNTVRTWVNGIPAAHWEDDGTYASGFFGLQIHKGNQGKVRFRNLRVRELAK